MAKHVIATILCEKGCAYMAAPAHFGRLCQWSSHNFRNGSRRVAVHGTLVYVMQEIYYAVWKVHIYIGIREQINDWPGPFDAKR